MNDYEWMEFLLNGYFIFEEKEKRNNFDIFEEKEKRNYFDKAD